MRRRTILAVVIVIGLFIFFLPILPARTPAGCLECNVSYLRYSELRIRYWNRVMGQSIDGLSRSIDPVIGFV